MKPRLIHFILSISVLLSACGQDRVSNAEQGIELQELHIANGDEPRDLDPLLSTGSPEHHILQAIFEGLVDRDPETLEIIPAVAESWDISEDEKTYTFKIRQTAHWSDGSPITASDFVYAWKRSLLPKFASEWGYMKYMIVNAKAFNLSEITDFEKVGVKDIDTQTLQVTLNAPTPYFIQLLWHPSYFPVHQKTIEAHAEIDNPVSKWTLPENMVSNGPFNLESWEVNSAIRVTRNPHYWDNENTRLNAVIFYPIVSQQAEERAFRSGQVHMTYTPQMSIEKIAAYKENEPESLRVASTYSSYFYEFNTTKKPYNDPRVRKAIALAVDRQTIVKHVTKGEEVQAFSFVPPDPAGYTPKEYFQYDVEKAKALLAEAGYPNGEGFPVTEILFNTHDNHRKVALAIQQMLKTNLNITVNLANQEWKVFLNSKRELNHDIARTGWIADYLDPLNFFELQLSYSGNNNTGWSHEEYDKIIETLGVTSNREQRFKLFEQANKILAEEMPILPLYYMSDINLVYTPVKGVHDNVMHYHPYKRVYLESNK